MRRVLFGTSSLLAALALLHACGRAPVATRTPASQLAARARATGVTITFAKPTLRPLPDKATDPEATAERTAIVLQANRDGVPVPGLRLKLHAGFVAHSGDHQHDEATRPVGAFYAAKPLGKDPVVTTDAAGQVKLTYRGSGIGGTDLVTASSDDGLTGQAELPLTYGLHPLPEPGPDDHYELVGRTDDHPDNHNCTPATQALMLRLAAEHFKLFNAPFKINDQSIPSGGPFDLGPAYGVPYWTLGSKHENHRQGNSTDIKSGTKAWREAITRLGGSVFVEASHWHVTTRADVAPAGALPRALDASRVAATITAATRYEPATNAIVYTYRLDAAPAVFALTAGSPVTSARAPRGWSGGAYFDRPLWSWAADDGAAAGSFELVSKGLPALQPAYLQAAIPVPDVAAVPPGVSEPAFARALDVTANSRHAVTLAPGELTTDAPLPTLLAYLHEQERRPGVPADLLQTLRDLVSSRAR